MNNEITQQKINEIDLVRLVGYVWECRKMVFSITLVCTLLAFIYSFVTVEKFQADMLIQIENSDAGSLFTDLSDILPNVNVKSAPEIVLLKSRMILGQTIDELNLRNVIERQYLPIIGRFMSRILYTEPAKLVVKELSVPRINGQYQTLQLTVEGKHSYLLQGAGFSANGLVDQRLEKEGVSIIIGAIHAAPGTKFLITQRTQNEALHQLMQNFTITEKNKDSGMLELTMVGEDPDAIALILNTIARNYFQQNIARQAAKDSNSLAFLDQQLPKIRQDLDLAEEKLNKYRQQRDSVDLSLEAKTILEQVVNTDNQLNALTFREAEVSQLYKKDHPTYRALLDKRQMLVKEKERLNQRVAAMPSTQQEILRLSRDVDTGRAVYLQLLNRQQELRISKSSAIGNVRIIDPAVTNPVPIKPRKTLIVILGFALGSFIAVAIILLRIVLRRGISSPDELEDSGIDVYATVPASQWLEKRTHAHKLTFRVHHRQRNKKLPLLALDNPGDLAIEAVRNLCTNLHFEMMGASNNILMFTSASPQSGKTFISSNLACLLADTNNKVLFIDADMRRGYTHKLFEMDNRDGLAEALMAKEALKVNVQHFKRGGFDVITRGQVPSNPAQLLISQRFQELLSWASLHYDIVIIDTPPVLAVTDASIIGRLVGTSLMVARFDINSVSEIHASIQRLYKAEVAIKGTILNGVVKRLGHADGNGYYHYQYASHEE
ncbi:TPA: polysaccharide biosynthesis tyrosine autokinase [Enterobacter cloacae]|uniref:polysaccharide biosynthesis tyrosine autokinase n=1 Tax=Enterobacter cloacae TaxID=550 RepID=UPI0021D33FC9|nr:polysaccharide biosynthesis tyrosine autokinase [Enterobacter cloacae]MCU6284578.1 polysaccharide biosynthesis tyrosine autokinase [Enterobacter cloacae]HEC5282793.1 polysaccharide biosynthesis tyrosine autokinase [Enterobacter cloacae]